MYSKYCLSAKETKKQGSDFFRSLQFGGNTHLELIFSERFATWIGSINHTHNNNKCKQFQVIEKSNYTMLNKICKISEGR